MYDEYGEDYLEAMPKEPVIEPRSTNGESQATMQSQEVGIGKDDKCVEGDSLPLCYSSFELIRHMIKASKKKHKLEGMVHSINLCGKEDDNEEQSCNPSLSTDASGICDEVLSHEEGGSSPQVNTFFYFMPLGISPHKGGICLLGFIE